MSSTAPNALPSLAPRVAVALALACAACREVPVDDFEYEGGTAPEPTGVIHGTVLYSGPRPLCRTDEGGNRLPLGNVILTLFDFDDPPPPAGGATGAANLLTIPGVSVFSGADDCLPDAPTPADRAFITRTAEFTWPELPLESRSADGRVLRSGDYQIRAFYDYDGNFNPFFSVTNVPTAGDVGGGAFEDPTAEVRVYRRIAFDSEAERPNGQVIRGVSVAVGAPVITERPVFYMTSARGLDSAGLLPTQPDPSARESALFGATETFLHLYDPASPGQDPASFEAIERAFVAAGMPIRRPDGSYDPRGLAIGDLEGDLRHAWYVREVDADGDGIADPHPTLGAAGVAWLTPVVLMQRQRSELELAAGIPDVVLVPTVSNVAFFFADRRVVDDDLPIAIPPLGAVTLNATDARCRVPFIPSGNTASVYERITVECQEVPTGDYSINAFQGIAAGRVVGAPSGSERMCTPPETFPPDGEPPPFLAADGCFDYPEAPHERERQVERCDGEGRCVVSSPTGIDLEGGTYSSQSWGIPNALGDPQQLPDVIGDPSAPTAVGSILLEQQGRRGLFTVEERTPAGVSGVGDCSVAVDDDPESATFGQPRPVTYRVFHEHFAARGDLDDAQKESERAALQALCCEPVVHLCGLDPCPVVEGSVANPGSPVRGTPTSLTDGRPDCVPFQVPDFCCEGLL